MQSAIPVLNTATSASSVKENEGESDAGHKGKSAENVSYAKHGVKGPKIATLTLKPIVWHKTKL